jgi:hypothetical protein
MAQAKEKPRFPPADAAHDFYAWCFEQADFLRHRRFEDLDVPILIEELESMGNEQRHALRSSYRLVIIHLLKWEFQPSRRTRSWAGTITRERINIEDRERANKTLRNEALVIVDEAYRGAVLQAAKETGLPQSTFPAACPYSVDQLRDPEWMPD